MKGKLVSVIMPAFNSEKFIRQAIDSILGQSYRRIELVVVNDGSTDSTLDIIDSYIEKDSRIKVVSQDNKGVRRLAETLNVGLNLCSGELVTMFPSDDICELDRFEHQVESFDDEQVTLSFGKMRLISDQGNVIGMAEPSLKELQALGNSDSLCSAYLVRNFISQPTVLFRRSKLVEKGGYQQLPYMYAEDYPTQMEFIGEGKWVYVNKFMARYRIHDGQMTNIHTSKMYRSDTIYRLRCLKRFTPRLITEKASKSIRKKIIENFYHGYFRTGLASWMKGDHVTARWYLGAAFQRGNRSTKIKAGLARTCISLGISPSMMMSTRRVLNRASL